VTPERAPTWRGAHGTGMSPYNIPDVLASGFWLRTS